MIYTHSFSIKTWEITIETEKQLPKGLLDDIAFLIRYVYSEFDPLNINSSKKRFLASQVNFPIKYDPIFIRYVIEMEKISKKLNNEFRQFISKSSSPVTISEQQSVITKKEVIKWRETDTLLPYIIENIAAFLDENEITDYCIRSKNYIKSKGKVIWNVNISNKLKIKTKNESIMFFKGKDLPLPPFTNKFAQPKPNNKAYEFLTIEGTNLLYLKAVSTFLFISHNPNDFFPFAKSYGVSLVLFNKNDEIVKIPST